MVKTRTAGARAIRSHADRGNAASPATKPDVTPTAAALPTHCTLGTLVRHDTTEWEAPVRVTAHRPDIECDLRCEVVYQAVRDLYPR